MFSYPPMSLASSFSVSADRDHMKQQSLIVNNAPPRKTQINLTYASITLVDKKSIEREGP